MKGLLGILVVSLGMFGAVLLFGIPDTVFRVWQKIQLSRQIAELRSQPADTHLLMPIISIRKNSIADTWNASRGEGRSHEGQDLFADQGTPIYSATQGYIIRRDQEELGGNTVMILGAGGTRYYYAHLDRYADSLYEGDKVTPDSIIGFVGNTGNAKDTPPHLHFGVYSGGEAINPLPLLQDR